MAYVRKGSRKLVGKAEPLHDDIGHAFAAFPGKWKRTHQDGADLLVNLLAHKLSRPMQPRFYRLGLKVEEVRRFLDAHSLDHARDENDSKDLRQIVRRSFYQLQNLTLRHRSFRIVGCRCLGELNDLGLGPLRFKSFQVYSRTLAPQPPQCFVHDDAGKPRGKARIAAISIEMGEGVDIGFLDDIFGFAVIPQDAARNPIKPAIVPLHDGAKRRFVTSERAPHEFSIVGREGNMRRGR